jgi:hypothetical protein
MREGEWFPNAATEPMTQTLHQSTLQRGLSQSELTSVRTTAAVPPPSPMMPSVPSVGSRGSRQLATSQ